MAENIIISPKSSISLSLALFLSAAHLFLPLVGAPDPVPAPWPPQFHSILIINSTKGALQATDLWYDYPNGRNFNIIQKQLGEKLYDLEWDNGTSYYYTLDDNRKCTVRHFPVGILRPNWLDGANYLGRVRKDGFLCDVWEKVDFITYYEDVATKRPVFWAFFSGIFRIKLWFCLGYVNCVWVFGGFGLVLDCVEFEGAYFIGMVAHVMTFEVGKVLDDPNWQAPVYCFQEGKQQNQLILEPASCFPTRDSCEWPEKPYPPKKATMAENQPIASKPSIPISFAFFLSAARLFVPLLGSPDPAPAPWPPQFHSILFIKNPSGALQVTDLWYDYPGGRNFNIIQKQLGKKLYDLEWDNGTSYYYTLDDNRECETMHFPVGILRPNWLEGANYLGRVLKDGFLCNVWEKVGFIWYYEDVATKRPVFWTFYDGLTTHVMTFEVGKVLEDPNWQAPTYCFLEGERANPPILELASGFSMRDVQSTS
ncbi:transferases [Striga asiatica]|uniref:Transferases n=1 Tax=Striga asiatica TaxID=4170 RepID=A0A5A7QGI8_STRAF|nr:transferases [Striga asiatica]